MFDGLDFLSDNPVRSTTLVIGGSLDRTRPFHLAKAVADVIPHAVYTEVRTSQYMAVQTPDIILDRIDAFLRAVDA
jgi:hypothetical protein